jgi:hypothetical protein
MSRCTRWHRGSRRCFGRIRLRPRSQRGYAYLMALFMVVALIIASQVAVRNVVTQGRREREEETIWRGQQYVRAIRMYYRKTGHYPTTLDDLKKGMPELHFLRYAAYQDPLNKDEGNWRFIYVNAAGQIIGSVKYATLQQMAILDMNGGKIPGLKTDQQGDQPGIPVSTLADQSKANSFDQAPANQPPQNPASENPSVNPAPNPGLGTAPDNSTNAGISPQPAGAPPPSQNGPPAAPNQSPQGASPATPTNAIGTPAAGPGGINTNLNNLNNQSLAALAALKPTGPVDGPVIGGFLTGVASSVDKPSVRIYNGGKKYIQWEFIWNPVEEQARAMQQGLGAAGGLPGQPGQTIGTGPAGTSPGGTNIFGNPGAAPNPGNSTPGNLMSPNPMSPNQATPPQSGP